MKPSWAPAKQRRSPATSTATASGTETPPDRTATATGAATGTEKQSATGPKPVTGLRAQARDVTPPAPEQPPQPQEEWIAVYLKALETNGGQKVAAAVTAAVSRVKIMRRRQSDSEFERAENDVMRLLFEAAESEATRRAIDGVESRTTTRTRDGTESVTVERKYSDTILLRLLEKIESGTWRQKQQIEHSGGLTFKTREERKAALERAIAAKAEAGPVSAINGRS